MSVRLPAAVAALVLSIPAIAQTAPPILPADANKPFRHANSGLTFPVALIGLPRSDGHEYVKPELDVAFRYVAPDGAEELTVYAYRATAGSPAIWFDAAIRSIEQRQAFGRKTRIERPIGFAPPGQSVASGFKAAWTLSNGPLRSTALAIVPMGEWLVKLRYSSRAYEGASLMTRLDAAILELGWPTVPAASAAEPITECSTPLKLGGVSKPVKTDGAAALIDAMMALDREKVVKPDAPKAAPVSWCRDSTVVAPVPIYRPNGTSDAYLGSLSDSGQAVWVRPSLAGLIPKNKPSWVVSIVRAGETINYPGRDRLPPPTQLGEILKGAAATRVATWGDERGITIDSNQLK